MAVVRKKQDDKHLKALRELVTSGAGNRQCFDCGQKGPTYVNMTIGSFVCTRCSGVLRGLTPPHRVKSISMATFTQEELDFLKAHGNDSCAKNWLGLWDPKRAVHQDHRELMIDKYERKRYYLEPASPLKSLTNAASLKSSAAASAAASGAASTATTATAQQNGNSAPTPLTNGYKMSAIDNSFQHIQLTPPTSQRTTANGLHKSSSSAISRPQQSNGFHQHHQQQQHQDAFTLNHNGHNGLNGHSLNGHTPSVGSASTGALSDTSSCASASNGFGPDADFVADFGAANIFDATSTTGSPAVSVSSMASTNGYAKIHPIKAAHQQQQLHQQQQHQMNGIDANASNGNVENFADFDHAPIFTANRGMPMPNGINRSATAASNTSNNNNHKLGPTPTEDRYAALKDLDEQLRESKAVAAAAATIVASSVVDSFGNHNNNNNPSSAGSVNPFKSQQQQINPFQAANTAAAAAQHSTQNLYGQMTVNGYGAATEGQQSQAGAAQSVFFNYNNASNMFAPAAASLASGPSGCGFGFGTMQQQMAATNGGMGIGGGAFNNPFAATGALSSNNPFL